MFCTFIPPHMSKKVSETKKAFAGSLKVDAALRDAREEAAVDISGPIRVYDAGARRILPGRPATSTLGDAKALAEYAKNVADLMGVDTFPDGVVRYGKDYANAFFNGSYLVFGEGDGEIFGNFTRARDIFAHELGHALVSLGPRLTYSGESGALNEHIADVFGVTTQQWVSQDTSDWRIGNEILLDGVSAVRDMLNPGQAYDNDVLGRDPQPGHMDDYRKMRGDNGGVHINSGIPNRAFALLCQITGEPSWGRPLAMWRRALDDLNPRSTFAELALATWRHSGGLNPAVREAWQKVGITL